jgi:Txe/YoeB family toxin of Txe-Axe toxin-antitoxin module
MDTNSPKDCARPEALANKYQAILQLCTHFENILKCEKISTVTFNYTGTKEEKPWEQTIFIPYEIVPEVEKLMYEFLLLMYHAAHSQRINLEQDLHLLRVGNQVIEITDFKTLYTDIKDIHLKQVLELKPTESCMISMNGKDKLITRIS